MSIPAISPDQLLRALQALDSLDVQGMLAALRAKNLQGDLVAAEDVLELVAAFWPEAMYARDALLLVGIVVKLDQAGLLRSTQPPVDPDPWGGRKQDDR